MSFAPLPGYMPNRVLETAAICCIQRALLMS